MAVPMGEITRALVGVRRRLCVKEGEEAICLNEHRSVVTTVECEDDIFFDMGSLICELDDICLFELLADVDATIYEL